MNDFNDHVQPLSSDSVQPLDSDEINITILMDVLAIFFGFIPPLVAYLMVKDKPFLREQSLRVLNATIVYMVVLLIAQVLNITVILSIIGLPLTIGVFCLGLYSLVMAAVKNSKGELYNLPFIPKFIK